MRNMKLHGEDGTVIDILDLVSIPERVQTLETIIMDLLKDIKNDRPDLVLKYSEFMLKLSNP